MKIDSNGCLVPGCNVGIEEIENEQVRVNVYPNPFSHSAYLRITNWYEFTNEEAELRIYDVLGREVKRIPIKGNQPLTIERNNLPSGIYSIS